MQQNQVGRERKQSGWDLRSWESVRGKQGLHEWRIARGVSHSRHQPAPWPWGPPQGGQAPRPAGGLVGPTGGVRKAGTPLVGRAWPPACSRSRNGGLRRHPAAPEPAPARDRWAPQWLASPHSSALGRGYRGPGRGLSRETTCDSGLTRPPSWAGAAVTASSTGGTLEAAGASDPARLLQATPNSCQGPTPALLLRHCLPTG